MSGKRNIVLRVLRSLSASGSGRLHESVVAQVAVAREAGELCRDLINGDVDSATARVRMTDLEHDGDRHRGALVRGMSRTLVTPIDREDLFRLSRAIDDVVDDLRDFVREHDLFQIAPLCDMAPVVTPIIEALDELSLAIDTLRDEPAEALEASLRTKKRAGGVRQAYQIVMAEMFADGASGVGTFQTLELLRRLDESGLSLHDAADALADGALKRVT